MKQFLPALTTSLGIAVSVMLFILQSHTAVELVYSATSHVVISEVKLAGANASDEFVELYNPTGSEIDLSGWRLKRKSSGATASETTVLTLPSGSLIAPQSFFLLVNDDAPTEATISADVLYATSLGAGNTLLLRDNATGSGNLVDKLGMGAAMDFEGTASAIEPTAGQSIERKATATSTSESLQIGGTEELSGNGYDSDDNAADFVLRLSPQPQSKISFPEPVLVTASPTATSTASSTPRATSSPTASPTPSASPTALATVTASPTPTLSPTPSASPTIIATVSPTPTVPQFPFSAFSCVMTYRTLNFGFFSMQLPLLRCGFNVL